MPYSETTRWILAIWLAAVGGCIGSFLNVVVYRLPRGMSLVRPGSRCPNCSHAIRLWHNIPVFGWLMLRGKCFDCRKPIAKRYPIVEASVAALFFVLAMYGPLRSSINDTVKIFNETASSVSVDSDAESLVEVPENLLSAENLRMFAPFFFQTLAATTLFALGLIHFDQLRKPTSDFRYPTKLAVVVLLFGLLASLAPVVIHPSFISDMIPVFALNAESAEGATNSFHLWLAFRERVAGLVLGIALGQVFLYVWRNERSDDLDSRRVTQAHVTALFSNAGVYCGPFGVLFGALCVAVQDAFFRKTEQAKRTSSGQINTTGKRALRASLTLFLATVVWFLLCY